MPIENYQKIQQIYNKEVKDILTADNVVIEEKIDGSQFRIQIETDGTIGCGSHHQELSMVDSQFKLATSIAESIFAGHVPKERITIFCEYLKSPSHNTLTYERVPKQNLMLFDVLIGDKYLNRVQKEAFAAVWNMELTPCLYQGPGKDISIEKVNELIQGISVLGKTKMEGVVIKAYDTFYDINLYPYLQGHFKMAKIVRPEFKEVNGENQSNQNNHLERIKEKYRTTARWDKAIQYCKDQGLVTDSMADMKHVIPRIKDDLTTEEKDNIKEDLWKAFGDEIIRSSVRGVPEWYKEKLMGTVKN